MFINIYKCLYKFGLVFGVRADPADYKLVSFFVTADEG